MIHSALLETLSVFTIDELADFHKFIHSPYFNEGPHARECIVLWECLRPYAPDFNHPDLAAEQVYLKVYPGKPFVKGKLDIAMSRLHQLAKQFAALVTASDYEVPESLRLAAFFRQRGLPQRALPLLEKLRFDQSQNPVHDARYWRERHLAESEQHLLATDLQNRHSQQQLAESIRSLHRAHLVQSLYLLNSLFFTHRKSDTDDALAETLAAGIPSAIQIAELDHEPLLRLLKTGFDFVRAPEQHGEAALRAFWQDLEANAHLLPDEMLRALFGYARNHCTWHYNRGKLEFAELNLALFKSCFQRKLLYENGKIQSSTYLNMVQAGLLARDFGWLAEVMPQCRDRIVGVALPAELYNYTLANYHYHLREYDRSLDFLRDGSEDLFNNLMVRKLELKIYYEIDSPLLDAKIENFKLFVFRQGKKHLPSDIFQMNNTFVDLLRGMVGAFGNQAKLHKLLKKAEAAPLLAERPWLLEQLRKLL